MALPELFILDVGHGNCAVLRDTGGTTVFDCAPGSTLKDTLEQLGINEITHLLISHADQDHIGGLIALLNAPGITIHNVHLNPDAVKRTEVWFDLRVALRDARATKGTRVYTSLTTEQSGLLTNGDIQLEVLAPTPELALAGVGGLDLKNRKLTSNSMSAVIRLKFEDHHLALISGDLDALGLENLLEGAGEIQSEILIFPHHGGNPGARNPREFAEKLCSHVKPRIVLFSISRSRAGFPRREVIEGVMRSVPNAHVSCTQLSEECAIDTPLKFPHLFDYPARGKASGSCCAGTIHIPFSEGNFVDFIAEHAAFVASIAPTMCVQKVKADA